MHAAARRRPYAGRPRFPRPIGAGGALPAPRPEPAPIEDALVGMTTLRAAVAAATETAQAALARIHPAQRASAVNLLHYLAFRRRDLRPLQLQLARLGLSSLGRAEAHVLTTLNAVLGALHSLDGRPPPPPSAAGVDFDTGEALLATHADALLGPAPNGRAARIMVTMPSEAAADGTLVHDLLRRGMDAMRINCAYDDADAWARMIAHLRAAEDATGRSCYVVMDLGGPKLRTGPLRPGPSVVKVRPRRDAYGRVVAPARVWITAGDAPAPWLRTPACPSPGRGWRACPRASASASGMPAAASGHSPSPRFVRTAAGPSASGRPASRLARCCAGWTPPPTTRTARPAWGRCRSSNSRSS